MNSKGQFVPIGATVQIGGKNYECTSIEQGESPIYDCNGCDLYHGASCRFVSCTGDFRKDGQWVIFKEVKQ